MRAVAANIQRFESAFEWRILRLCGWRAVLECVVAGGFLYDTRRMRYASFFGLSEELFEGDDTRCIFRACQTCWRAGRNDTRLVMYFVRCELQREGFFDDGAERPLACSRGMIWSTRSLVSLALEVDYPPLLWHAIRTLLELDRRQAIIRRCWRRMMRTLTGSAEVIERWSSFFPNSCRYMVGLW